MGLWDLITEDEKSVEEIKEAEVVEEQPTEPQEQAVEQATAAQTQQEAGVDAKDASEEKQATPKKKKPAGKKGEHLYPFSIYSEGRIIDISSYGFVPGKTYKEDEITKIMLQHQHYEFAGKMEYSFIKEDNVLVVSIAQHRKG